MQMFVLFAGTNLSTGGMVIRVLFVGINLSTGGMVIRVVRDAIVTTCSVSLPGQPKLNLQMKLPSCHIG